MPSTHRGTLLRATPAATLLLALTACSGDSSDASVSPSAPASSTARQETPAASTPSRSDRTSAMDIRVTLDGRPVDATSNDSPAARDLATLLPLTLDLEDFHGTERIGYPPRRLTTDGAPAPVAAKAGDIAYFAPWGNLALFYQDGPSASPDLLILGHIDAAPDQLARAERITIEPAS
ncbi:cyclophilin-like fold protein [Streptomyces sp. NPDC001315]|uniref:cyclophilin-like fold protein n=1 Tax=Streptomyces sp. NPDC001315 TaxID=3364562 RepID=UPI0036B90FA7